MILGNRDEPRIGGALWRSDDGYAFTLTGEPALRSGPGETVRVDGATVLADGTVVVVGTRAVSGRPDQAVAWSSPDGAAWQLDDASDLVPDGAGPFRGLRRVVATTSGAIAVGVDDAGATQVYRAARRDATGRWQLGGEFGPTENGELPTVGALATAGDRVAALVRVRGQHELWWSRDGDSWTRGELPQPIPADALTSVVMAGDAHELLLAAHGPQGSALWSAPAPS